MAGDTDADRLRGECEAMGILTRDAAVFAVFRDLKKAARASLPILILGEPGTGKELFARAAHRLGRRADQAFVAVNVAAISPELFESELFGHVKGAFTGAAGERRGFFELADRGTIFLDEIGELRIDHQSKLLRVLQEKSF
jgi:Nif-specific regulatory protein